MKTLYTAFKGKNNTSYQLVSRIDNNSLFLTNSFTGLEKDITRFDCDFDAVYMFGIDKNLVDKIRIDLCACYNSEHTLIVTPVGIENRPIVNTELLYVILADTQTPQLFFLGFFPEPPFLFFSGFVVRHTVSSNLNF